MPVIDHSKREKFAQLVAKGVSVTKAYVSAGYSPKGAQPSAARLLSNYGLQPDSRAAGSTLRRHHRPRDQQPQFPRRGAPKALGSPERRPGSGSSTSGARTWPTFPAARAGCSRVHELQDAPSAATITLEIRNPSARVAALQKRWDRLRARLDLILDRCAPGRCARRRHRIAGARLHGNLSAPGV
jgi:hypothetical protein